MTKNEFKNLQSGDKIQHDESFQVRNFDKDSIAIVENPRKSGNKRIITIKFKDGTRIDITDDENSDFILANRTYHSWKIHEKKFEYLKKQKRLQNIIEV